MGDVARLAGVSHSTVSRVVNNDRYVGERSRQRVEDAIAALGFRPNPMAQRLRPGRSTDTIGLVIEDVSNPFYSRIAEGVDSVAQHHRKLVILGATRRSADRERDILDELLRRRVDGLLVVPTKEERPELYERLRRWAPTVFIDRRPRGTTADTVVLDNQGGALRAVTQLIEAGHDRIAYIGGASAVYTGRRRLAGYRKALRSAGIEPDPDLVRLNNHDTQAARTTALDLLTAASPPSAIFADNNRMTVGVLAAVHQAGHRAAVAGFDDVELADLLGVPVTLVSYDAADLGRHAAELLFARIAGHAGRASHITVPTDLITHKAWTPRWGHR
ncbi:LacI family DNA-binding transcriptional regulator [Actinopolymorpha alba]|uniref:LacI family DNA-binding transcriptional regulator n=1 Tax=Actinopolymorpha alba TaxID=533267 RepID=UPI00035FA387|nr:LacI family DNA-binding transcriptional regulator [Actinopolymorpha alba]